MLSALPFLYVFIVWRKKQAEDAYAGLDPVERRRLEARNAAMKHLESAESVIDEDSRKYFEELSNGLFTYISGKFSIPHSEISKDKVKTTLEDRNLDAPIIDSIMTIVSECEMALYAGALGSNPDHRRELYDRTVDAIMAVDDSLDA